MLNLDSVRNSSVGYQLCFSQPHWNIVVVVVHTWWFWYSTYRIQMIWWFLSHTLLHSNSNWDTVSMYTMLVLLISSFFYFKFFFYIYSFSSLFLRKHFLCVLAFFSSPVRDKRILTNGWATKKSQVHCMWQ